jgi:hypothetical protein
MAVARARFFFLAQAQAQVYAGVLVNVFVREYQATDCNAISLEKYGSEVYAQRNEVSKGEFEVCAKYEPRMYNSELAVYPRLRGLQGTKVPELYGDVKYNDAHAMSRPSQGRSPSCCSSIPRACYFDPFAET